MAVGIEQIAGPVNAGDIIMRDEEAPRGAAALLNKMSIRISSKQAIIATNLVMDSYNLASIKIVK